MTPMVGTWDPLVMPVNPCDISIAEMPSFFVTHKFDQWKIDWHICASLFVTKRYSSTPRNGNKLRYTIMGSLKPQHLYLPQSVYEICNFCSQRSNIKVRMVKKTCMAKLNELWEHIQSSSRASKQAPTW